GRFEEMRHVLFMCLEESFGQENGVGFSDDLLLRITEHLLGTGINKENGPVAVDDDHPFGQRLQKGAYRDISLEKPGSKSNLPLDSQFLFQALFFPGGFGYGHWF